MWTAALRTSGVGQAVRKDPEGVLQR